MATTTNYSWPTPDNTNYVRNGASDIRALGTAVDTTVKGIDNAKAAKAASNTFTANQVIEVTDNTNAALRVTQLGTGDAIRVEDSANPDTTPFLITAAGDVGIGAASPQSKLHVVSSGDYAARVSGDAWVQLALVSARESASDHAMFSGFASRGTTAAPTAILDGDIFLTVDGRTYGSTGFLGSTGICSIAAENHTDTARGSMMVFSTTPIGSVGSVQRMKIDSAGLITGSGTSLGAWTAYTPTWTGSTTNPVLGNGSIDAKYMRLGKLVICTIEVTMGSTTTFGSGAWFFTLPVTASSASLNPKANAIYKDASAAAYYYGHADDFDGSGKATLRVSRSDATYLTMDSVSPTIPFTWATSDVIQLQYVYEAA